MMGSSRNLAWVAGVGASAGLRLRKERFQMNAVVNEFVHGRSDGVRAVLNYTRNTGVRPVNYTFDPPPRCRLTLLGADASV